MNTIDTAIIPLEISPRHRLLGSANAKLGTAKSGTATATNLGAALPELGGNLIYELVEEFWQAGIRTFIFTSTAQEADAEHWESQRSIASHYKHQLIKRLGVHYGKELTIIWQNSQCQQSLGDTLLDCQGLVGNNSFVLGLASHVVIPEYYYCLRDMIENANKASGDVIGLNLAWFNHQQQISDTGLGFVSASVGSKYRSHSISFSKLQSCKCWNFGRFIFTPQLFERIHRNAELVTSVEDLTLLDQEESETLYYCGPSFFFNCDTLDGFLEAEKYFSQLRHGYAAKA